MIRDAYLHEAGKLRYWSMGREDNRISRLGDIENKIPSLLGSEKVAERTYLVQTLAYDRHRRLAERFMSCHTPMPNLNLKNLEERINKLSGLLHVIQKQLNLGEWKKAFFHLPDDVQGLLYWAVWVEWGAPNETDFGRKKLHQQFSLLSDIRSPLLYPNGNGICEQALHYYESLYIIERKRCTLDLAYSKEDEECLHKLEQLQQLAEYEGISLLYHRMNPEQRQAILDRASLPTKKFIQSLASEYHHKEWLKNDPDHLYLHRGAHRLVDGTAFQVFAPNAKEVHLVLRAFGKEEHTIPMNRNGYGVWEVFTEHAHLGRTYRYRICSHNDHWQERTDPFSFAIRETDGTAESIVSDIDSYDWNDHNWMHDRAKGKPLEKPLSIYELNVDYWKKKEGGGISFVELAHEIVEYHKKFPFTHVELYGVIDNRHDYSCGYQLNHPLAPNRRMGGMNEFKFLIDHCHQNGIGVIIDFVPSHFKHEHAGDLSQTLHDYDGTNLFASDPTPWGTMYFDFGKEETRRLLLSSLLYWSEVFHSDGFRLDAVGPMLKRDGDIKWDAVNFLKEANCKLHERYPGILTIAEETDGFEKVTRPVWEGGLGFDANVGGVFLQRNFCNYLKTPYDERGKDEHHFGKLIANLEQTSGDKNWMMAHSHDDASGETLYRCVPTDDQWRCFGDMRLFHGWNLLAPGAGHLIHMGDELGQIWPWNERLNAMEGAVEWHRLNSSPHSNLLHYVGDLNRLYISNPPFWKLGNRGYKPISHCAANKVIGFHRYDDKGGRLAVFFNFSTMGYRDYDFPLPSLKEDPEIARIKEVKEIFNSDGIQYGGTGNFGNQWAHIVRNEWFEPTHFRIAMPPLSILVFEERMH